MRSRIVLPTFRLLLPLILITLMPPVPFSLLAEDDLPYYIRKQTWHESLFASREAMTRHKEEMLKSMGVKLGPWRVVGPFHAETPYATAFGPEKDPGSSMTYEKDLSWVTMNEWPDGTVVPLPRVAKSANYLTREIIAKTARPLTLYLGSDDGIRVWLNDRLVLEHDINRACSRNQEVVTVDLHKGANRLLMKVTNGSGPSAFYFSLVDLDPLMLWRKVQEDFSTPAEQEEMAQESLDGIWDMEWERNGYAALAKRYIAAAEERAAIVGIAFASPPPPANTVAGLRAARESYRTICRQEQELRSAEYKDMTLTPKPGPEPRINGPRIFGVRPGHPFLYRIPATGDRPMEFSAADLPHGLACDARSGIITGTVKDRGTTTVTLTAKNSRGAVSRTFTIVVGDRIALTPPLGWNSWNCFAEDVDDAKVRAAADAMVKSGLIDHGWTYINIDDCWMVKPDDQDPVLGGEARDKNGMIQTNKKFPDMKALSAYVHGLGLKLGIYSSPGPLTCAGYAGSYRYEVLDARQYADWGIDYLKYDWCSYRTIAKDQSRAEYQKPYRVMRAALDGVNRDIVFSLCQYGMDNVWEWGDSVGGNCWRTTGDITDTWESMSTIGFGQSGHEAFAGPGHWNDPDMLVVGWVGWGPRLHPTRLTAHEQITHITLWSLLCSPLLIGCDMTRLDEFTLSLLTNDEVIAVNQDPLGKQAARVKVDGDAEVWAKPMDDGSVAVGLFNRGEKGRMVTISW
ncbi:MAG: putative Ig domain-containing protein, partial [Bacteroidetes bacterium]|nr:putative Ig domain-containing protein [Bacteroidota bacterium]